MDHPDLSVSNFMEKSIGLQRVKLLITEPWHEISNNVAF